MSATPFESRMNHIDIFTDVLIMIHTSTQQLFVWFFILTLSFICCFSLISIKMTAKYQGPSSLTDWSRVFHTQQSWMGWMHHMYLYISICSFLLSSYFYFEFCTILHNNVPMIYWLYFPFEQCMSSSIRHMVINDTTRHAKIRALHIHRPDANRSSWGGYGP